MRRIKDKSGAIEMSIGTIVIIVLAMTMLILGIFLVQKIFKSATGAVDLTDEQLRSEINKLFGEDKELVIYPSSRRVEIKQGKTDGVGIGIKNFDATDVYSYNVVANSGNNCPEDFEDTDAFNLIILGDSEEGIAIEAGGFAYRKVLLEIPQNAPICSIRYSISVTSEGGRTFPEFFDITIKAK